MKYDEIHHAGYGKYAMTFSTGKAVANFGVRKSGDPGLPTDKITSEEMVFLLELEDLKKLRDDLIKIVGEPITMAFYEAHKVRRG